MNAAKSGSPEGVESLLKALADPNIEDTEGMTAIAYGIISGNVDVIELLAPITTSGVDQIIVTLAQSSVSINGEIENYLRRITDENKMNLLLDQSSFYGNHKMLDYLLNAADYAWSEIDVMKALENAIISDNEKSAHIVKEYIVTKELLSDIDILSKLRGMKRIENLFNFKIPKLLVKQSKHKFPILEKLPK